MLHSVNYDNLSVRERRVIREQYVKEQNGLCYWCECSLNKRPEVSGINWGLFPNGFLKNPIHLHHDHNTGMTIGAVHAECNAVLWQLYDQ